MNKDLYIEMLEKRVAELEENKKDVDFAVEQNEGLEEKVEDLKQKLADLESRNELVIKILKIHERNHWGNHKAYRAIKGKEKMAERELDMMVAVRDSIALLKDDNYLNDIANIWDLA